jgi:hypothetical protein
MKALNLLLLLTALTGGCSKNPASLQEKAASAFSQLSNPGQSKGGQPVVAAQFAPDGQRIIVTSKDGTTRIWDAKSGQPLSSTNAPSVQVWDTTTGQPIPPRYQPDRPDNMPMIGPDNFQRLQDQIDALEKRVQELEKKAKQPGR